MYIANSPEALGLMVNGSSEPTGLSMVELGEELGILGLVRIGSKLHCDWFSCTRWFGAIQ